MKWFKKHKLIDLEILDIGRIEEGIYYNPLIGWKFTIPTSCEASLQSIEERKRFYEKCVSGQIQNTIEEQNKILVWTNLLSVKDEKHSLHLRSRIRRKNYQINNQIESIQQEQISAFRESKLIDQNFSYSRKDISISGYNFSMLELSEINYIGSEGGTFCFPFIRISGFRKDILIDFTISFKEKLESSYMIDLIKLE